MIDYSFDVFEKAISMVAYKKRYYFKRELNKYLISHLGI